MRFAQSDRPMKLTTPLGEDQFILTSLSGSERISGLFQFQLNAAWQGGHPVVFKEILGKSVTVELEFYDVKRYVNGIVHSISQGPRVHEQDVTLYTLTVVPKLWLLTRRVNCRIFQKKTTPVIIQEVLHDAGINDFELKLQGSYQPRDYCVQYYESDFAFISRLMEFEGICYFFRHSNNGHTLVLSDDKSSFADLPGGANIDFDEVVGGLRDVGRISGWHRSQQIHSGKYSLNDYNFKTPDTSLLANSTTTISVANNDSLEIYENPGDYLATSDGEHLAKLRMAEVEMRGQVVTGTSYHAGLAPGFKFNLKAHFSDSGKYTVTSVTHSAQQPLETGATDESFAYENGFTCIAFQTQYRPERVTPLPDVRGVQTALVVGPGGEEIYTDEHGRIKVQFHWDRLGKKDENSSCWVRVATPWAGQGWGALHIPRIGQEVIVDFVEGDLDHPIVVGSVYNASQMPPYPLPDEKTKSTLKSNSSKGGGGYNEFRFEDKKGSEEVYFRAQKDLNSLIKNNETREVDNDRTTVIKHDETQTVTNNETIVVKQGNQTITLNQGDQSTRLQMGNQSTKIDMGNQDIKLGMGNQNTKLDLGAATTEAMQSITLKVGESSIVVDQMGVTIKGMMISIQGQIQVQVTGLMTQVNGDAMTTVQGAIVMIN